MTTNVKLEAFFIHPELVLRILEPNEAQAVTNSLPPSSLPFAALHIRHALEGVLNRFLETRKVPALASLVTSESLVRGQLTWIEQSLYYRTPSAKESAAGVRPSFTSKLDVDKSVSIVGTFNPDHITGSTGRHELTGHRRHFMVGFATQDEDEIELRPLFIGNRYVLPPGDRFEIFAQGPGDALHVWPGQIDQFKDVDFNSKVTKADLEMLRSVSETEVKIRFADIIGEAEVPKDWGGEQFDLWTRMLSVDGQRVRAAIAFKGPSAFHPMRVTDLGKNGDQIERLAATAADLLVVQHCHSITAPVVNTLRAFATTPGNFRRYMTIDGYETIRILRHFERL